VRILVAGAVVVLVLLALTGRFERSHWIDAQNDAIARVRAAVAPRFEHPYAFRNSPTFACLIWHTAVHPLGRELCYDPSGAVIEAIERYPNRDPRIWTLRSQRSAATVRDDPRTVANLLDRLGAQSGSVIVVGNPDIGPQ
jgi:uncharacterized membrane protein